MIDKIENIKKQKDVCEKIINHLQCQYSKEDLEIFFDTLNERYIEKYEMSKLVHNLKINDEE